MSSQDDLKNYIRDVVDYPQKGIVFRDITPLLGDKQVFREVVDLMSRAWSADPPDLVAAIEARGFIPGAAMAVKLDAGFVPIRKTGKLPWSTVMESYELEYGTDSLEVHADAVQPGQKVLIVDDVLATGELSLGHVEGVRDQPGARDRISGNIGAREVRAVHCGAVLVRWGAEHGVL